MIDLKELRKEVNGKNIPYVSVPKTLMLELLNRLEAAEKVCDAADIVIKKPGQIKAHWHLTKAMMAWQEVNQCADQQQKKS